MPKLFSTIFVKFSDMNIKQAGSFEICLRLFVTGHVQHIEIAPPKKCEVYKLMIRMKEFVLLIIHTLCPSAVVKNTKVEYLQTLHEASKLELFFHVFKIILKCKFCLIMKSASLILYLTQKGYSMLKFKSQYTCWRINEYKVQRKRCL